MIYDLSAAEGLTAALRKAGSWAQLSRTTGVAASTLKSRGERLGVRPGRNEPVLGEGFSLEVEHLASVIAHAIVATVIEHEKGHPIEQAWELHERMWQRNIADATHELLPALGTANGDQR